ncbi:MAG: oxidoreductase [Polyangiaceae bacterium]
MGIGSLVLLGASGLVGGAVLRQATADASCSSVTLLTRRPLGLGGGKIREEVVDFERPETFRAHLAADHVVCCLGTTIKQAGSQEAFRKVDFDIPVAVAREAAAAGAGSFLIVTAVGADPESRVFYSRIKGEAEAAVRELPFPRGVKILRPSILVGKRARPRTAERAVMALMRAARPLLAGKMARYRAIDADDVARAILDLARRDATAGVAAYEGESLFALARGA